MMLINVFRDYFHKLKAAKEENSVQIDSVKLPTISSPTEAYDKLPVN
jgi:hypothetical protein